MASAQAKSMKRGGTGVTEQVVYAARNMVLWTASGTLNVIERHGKRSYSGHRKQCGRYESMNKR
jgi:hypothetical protein